MATLCALTASCAFAQGTDRQPNEIVDPPWRVVRHHESHQIAADGTEVAHVLVSTKVLKSASLPAVKETTLHHSKSAQTLQILEANTTKPDGRRIDAPKDNYQVRADTGMGTGGPAFSDTVSTTVVFPSVEVGDTVTLSYRMATTDPLFPGKLSLLGRFPKSIAYDEVRVSVDHPDTLHARHRATGMDERVTRRNGRTRVEWTLRNPKPLRDLRQNHSVFDIESHPGFLFSTFASYADIAASYLSRARPKAAVTQRILRLADEITAGKADPREQAKALAEWVAERLTYAGHCVGIGAVVPRDLDVVLDNRMGDCKDRATLLQALLAAKNIRSEQALVNAGSVYRLPPDVPIASLVNHVINYLPDFDLFVDATDPTAPFGHLPVSVQDKPVLLPEVYGTRKTPADPPGRSAQEVEARWTVKGDGSLTGVQRVRLKGRYAIETRAGFKDLSPADAERWVTGMLEGMKWKGSGSVTHGDTSGLSDEFDYEMRFEVKDFVPVPSSAALQLHPLLFTPAPVVGWGAQAAMKVDDVDVVCVPGASRESLEIELPDTLETLSLPTPTAFSSRLVRYESSYRLEGRTLRVQRVLEDLTPGNVCSPEVMREYTQALQPVLQDLRQTLLYRAKPAARQD